MRFYIFKFSILIAFILCVQTTRAQVTKTNPMKVYVHYMPWFETPETLGADNWGYHWKLKNCDPNKILESGQREIASHFYPKIGPYASRNPHVIEYHLLLMKLAGIDGVTIDWYGTAGSNGDIESLLASSNAIVAGVKKFGMKFAVVLEDRFATSSKDVATNVEYLKHNYFSRKEYIRLGADNDPLLMVFGPITQQKPDDWKDILASAGEDVMLLPLWYEKNDAGEHADGEYAWIYEDESKGDHLSRQKAFLDVRSKELEVAGAVAYPGFKDFYVEGGVGEVVKFNVPHAAGKTLDATLKLAGEHSANVDFVQLATWNDFSEGTMLEPTIEFGFEYLMKIQKFTGVSWGKSELELVHKLYVARTSTDDVKIQADLDKASLAINELDFKTARGIVSKYLK